MQFAHNFHINPITPLSEHNSISVNLMTSVEIRETNKTLCLAKYKWKDVHQDKYVNNLHKPTALNQLHCLAELCSTTSDEVDIETCVDMLNNVILTAAEPCKVKIRSSERVMSNTSPWYGSECAQSRKNYNLLRNKYNRTTDDADKKNRDDAKVQYKSLCKRKCKCIMKNRQL